MVTQSCHSDTLSQKRVDTSFPVQKTACAPRQTHVVAVVAGRYICGALWLYRSPVAPSPGLWKHLSQRLPFSLCGQSVRWRCGLLAPRHGTHGYLQQQCSLTGKWSRSTSKLSSVSPGSAVPDCSDSQSDITKCQPPLLPHFPPPCLLKKKKINIP